MASTTIKVHHLNDSRSQRILWLLEELGLEYEIVNYQRNETTRFAPPELKAIHPLGKSPLIEDNGKIIAESGCIVEYLIRTYQNTFNRFMPEESNPQFYDYLHWLHFAEGSAMTPFLLKIYTSFLGEGGQPLQPRITSEIANHLSYLDNALGSKNFFVGESLSGADIQLSFVVEIAKTLGLLNDYPNLDRYLSFLQSRPAYKKALERGGPYSYGPSKV